MLREAVSIHTFKEVVNGTTGDTLMALRRGLGSSVIKHSFVDEEYRGWQLVRDHLKVLQTRRVFLDGETRLVVKFCPSSTLSELTNKDDPSAVDCFDAFFDDLTDMWIETAQPYDQVTLKRDYAAICLRLLDAYRDKALARLGVDADAPIILDDLPVGSVDGFFRRQQVGLSVHPSLAVLSHGDENFGNILSPHDRSDPYKVIDARFAGYYDPAWVLGNIYSRIFLFNATYPESVTQVSLQDNVVFNNALPTIPKTAQIILDRLVRYIEMQKEQDPDISSRMAAYVGNNIGRSIAHMRDSTFKEVCDNYGIQHFLTAMREADKIAQIAH